MSAKLLSLSDFEWGSTARYIIYISRIAGLQEINSDHVVSFPLARIGPEKLLKQKRSVLKALAGNKKSIERFVGEYSADLDENEVAVLRSLYLQYRANEEAVKGHIAVIEDWVAEIELSLLQNEEGGQDDSLF